MNSQTLLLMVTPFMFFSLAGITVAQSVVTFMLYKENRRWKHLCEISHWGCTALIDAAKHAFNLANLSAGKRWDIFILDLDNIQKIIRDGKNQKPTG